MKILLTTDTVGGVWTYSIELARALHFFPPPVLRGRVGRGPAFPPLPPGEGRGEGELRTSFRTPNCGAGFQACTPPGGADILVCPESESAGCTHPAEQTQSVGKNAFPSAPIQIALATMGAPLTSAQRNDLINLPHVTLFESQFKLEWMPDPWQDVIDAGHWLLDIADSFKPDLIHLNTYPHASLPWNVPVLTVAHSCVLSWWQAVKSESAPSQWNDYRRAVRDGLRASDLVIAPSAAMLQSVDSLYGPLPQTRVIPNARNPSLFHPAPKKNQIFSAGRLWDEAKNVAALTRVADKLPWPVQVAGEGGDSLPSTVRWLGRLDQYQMSQSLSRAAIYALPARYEPFGLSVLEAALSGCALVLGDIPSLHENWSGAALFVDPNDDDQLAQSLNHLITNPGLRDSLAGAALARSRRFTPERFATDYLSAYRDLFSPVLQIPQPAVERIPVCGS